MESRLDIKNKKASFEYALMQSFEAGMVLSGTEIKAIRSGKVNLTDSYCVLINGEMWVRNMHIAEYDKGSYNNHPTRQDRKLLLNRSELKKIASKLKDKGITVVPLRMYLNEKGWAKLEISLAKGKKVYDKRESIKERDVRRDMERNG